MPLRPLKEENKNQRIYGTMNTERGNCKEVKCMKMLKFSARQLSNSQSKYAQLYKHKQCCKVNWSLHDRPQRGEKETWRSIEHKRSSHANQVGEWDSEMLNKRETAAQRPRAAPLASFCLLQLPLMHLPSYGRRSFFRLIPASWFLHPLSWSVTFSVHRRRAFLSLHFLPYTTGAVTSLL